NWGNDAFVEPIGLCDDGGASSIFHGGRSGTLKFGPEDTGTWGISVTSPVPNPKETDYGKFVHSVPDPVHRSLMGTAGHLWVPGGDPPRGNLRYGQPQGKEGDDREHGQ